MQQDTDLNGLHQLVRALIAINLALDPKEKRARKPSPEQLRELLLGLEEEFRCALNRPDREDWL